MEGAVAFVCAMPLELAAVVKAAGLHRPRAVGLDHGPDGLDVRRGTVGRYDVVAIATGMGTVLARRNVTRLLDAVDVRRVCVIGIAGGVDTSAPIGTVVTPAVVIDAASGTEHVPEHLLPGTPNGSLWTTDEITSSAEVVELRARGVIALDMETAAIGAVCEERQKSWSVFRAISDDPSDEVDEELFGMANQDGSPNLGKVLGYVLRHPGRLARLARMGRHSTLAAQRAASAAVTACEALV